MSAAVTVDLHEGRANEAKITDEKYGASGVYGSSGNVFTSGLLFERYGILWA